MKKQIQRDPKLKSRLEAMVNLPVPHKLVFEQGDSVEYRFIRPNGGNSVAVVIRNLDPYDPLNFESLKRRIEDINSRFGTVEGITQGLAEYKLDTVEPAPRFPEYQPPA